MRKGIDSMIGYINAGGRGTRLNGLFTPHPDTGIAKALLEIGDPKVKLVDHHIANLRQQNIERVVVAAGDQPDVYEYVNDIYGHERDIRVTRSLGQLGTGGDLVTYVREFNPTSPIIIQNVDTILDINLDLFSSQLARRRPLGAQACIALTLIKGVPNEGAFVVGMDDKITHSAEFSNEDETATAMSSLGYRGSSTGSVIMYPDFLHSQKWREQDGQLSLYRQTLRQAWQIDGLYAYNNQYGFFRDIGTVATWLDSEADVELQSMLHYDEQKIGKLIQRT